MDLEEEPFPADCDAVVFRLAAEEGRPRIVLNSLRPPARRRFTLAHELAHYFVPWHLGTIICHTDPGADAEDHEVLHWAMEQEANEFASEFLIPTAWLRSVFREEANTERAIARVEEARTSLPAACYALRDFLPPGHVLAVLEPLRVVRYLFRSDGTNVNTPHRGERLDFSTLNAVATEHAAIPFANQTLYWWYFEPTSSLLVESDDDRRPTEIVRDMLADVFADQDEREAAFRSIQAVSGYAKNVASNYEPSTLLATLRQRFAQRPEFREVVAHPDFELWLSRRAEELARPR